MPEDVNDKKNVSGAQFVQPPESFHVANPPTLVKFNTESPSPAFPKYIGVDDSIFIQVIQTAFAGQIQVNVRILRPDNTVLSMPFQVFATSINTVVNFTFPLVEGWLLSCAVEVPGNLLPATNYFATVSIVRNPKGVAGQYDLLCSGYLNQNLPIGYPQSIPMHPRDGQGALRSTQIATPAAGVDFTFTLPAITRMRIIAVSGLLTTAVAVANRLPSLILDDGANILAAIPSGNTEVASLAAQYTWADSCQQVAAFDNKVIAPLPGQTYLQAGFRIRSTTTGIQAADTWTNIFFLSQVWFDP